MKISTKKVTQFFQLSIALLMLFSFTKIHAQFTGGNVTLLQISDGVATFTNSGNVVILKEFTPAGAAAYSMSVPSTGTNALIMGGAATSEGGLTLSADNRYLVFGGYAQALPNAASLNGATASAINRAVGSVNAAGSFTRASINTTFYSTGNIRSAASDGNNNYWTTGSNDGTNYFGTASPSVTIQNAITNTRCILIANNNLYFSSGSGTQGIYKIGTGLPVTSGQTNSLIINVVGTGVGTPSPYSFFFNAAQTICYIADDRTITNGGGIQKWINAAGTWSLSYTLGTGSLSTVGARGVVADFSGANPIVYATTADGTNNRLISIVDAGATATAVTMATSVTNAIFRGLAFSPSSCAAPTLSISASSTTVCATNPVTLTASGATSYTWSNGIINGGTINPTVTAIYTVTGNSGTCPGSSTIAITVNPLPALLTNSVTICSGQAATLTATGANTYSWSTSATSGSVSVTPTINTTYTVTGATPAGCSRSITTQVIVTNSPALTVNSATICSGNSATLTAGGASTFTWSTGAFTNSIVINPATNTTYTLSGSLTGCAGTATGSASVQVDPLPSITVSGSSIVCSGSSVSQTLSGAFTYSLNGNASTATISINPTAPTNYTITGMTSAGCSSTAVKNISVAPLPTITIAGNASVCAGSTISLTLAGAAGYSLNGNSTPAVLTLTPSSSANYSVSGSSNGCTGNATKSITVNSLPVMTLSSTSSTVCAGATATITASGASTYSWSNGVGSGSSITVTPSITTTYSVTGVSSANCSSASQIIQTVSACTSLGQLSKTNSNYVVYPNPAKNVITIDNLSADKTEITIVNALGATVFVEKNYTSGKALDISNLSNGIYFIKIGSETGNVSKKLIVE